MKREPERARERNREGVRKRKSKPNGQRSIYVYLIIAEAASNNSSQQL